MASVCVDPEYFDVGADGRLTVVPGSASLREVLYFKTAGSETFEKADYPWLARLFVQVQAAGGGAAGARANAGQLVAHPGGTGGGYSERLILASALGAMERIIVGAGMAWVANAYNVPVCAAYIRSEDYPIVFAGSGCHFDPRIALSRALTEAAQSRLTCIAGTRDDLDSHENAFAASFARPALAHLPTGDWNNLTRIQLWEPDDLDAHLNAVAASVADVTGYEPIAFTLHDAEAYAAVKVVSPGLEMRTIRSIPRPGGRRA